MPRILSKKSCPNTVKGKRRRNFYDTESACPGLTKTQLHKNKRNQIVSKRKHAIGVEIFKDPNSGPKNWNIACKEAFKELGYWPVPIKKATEFHVMATHFYEEILDQIDFKRRVAEGLR